MNGKVDDLINRSKAIRWIKAECNPYGQPTLDYESGIKVIKHLERMPSAQSEIIKCKDCKYMTEHYDTDGNVSYWICSEWDSGTDYDGFCHYAERKKMSDLIERREAIDAIHNLYAIHGSEGSWIDQKDAFKAILNLPSAQPEPKWIPCSERLPEEDGRYYVTLQNGYEKILSYSTTQTIRYPKGFYYVTDEGIAWRQTQNPVVAWMPLPKPYQKDGD